MNELYNRLLVSYILLNTEVLPFFLLRLRYYFVVLFIKLLVNWLIWMSMEWLLASRWVDFFVIVIDCMPHSDRSTSLVCPRFLPSSLHNFTQPYTGNQNFRTAWANLFYNFERAIYPLFNPVWNIKLFPTCIG